MWRQLVRQSPSSELFLHSLARPFSFFYSVVCLPRVIASIILSGAGTLIPLHALVRRDESDSEEKAQFGSAARAVSPPAARRKVSPPSTQPNEGLATTSTSILDRSHFNIFSWNVNGIGPLSFDGSTKHPLRAFLQRHQWPALLCVQEVKIAPKDFVTRRAVHTAANTGFGPDEPKYSIFCSLPRDKYNATGFGGKVHGVATLVRDDVTIRGIDASLDDSMDRKPIRTMTKDAPWDLEGRVLVTLLPDYTAGRKLAVINGYWVNGTENPYRDPLTGEVSGTRHDHKLRFHKRMLEECQRFEQDGYHVVLVGDMNIAPARVDGHPNLRITPVQHVKNRADFNEKFLGKGGWGVDAFRALHGSKRKFTYHPRRGEWGLSCDRVDLVITGKSLMEETVVVGCDIEENARERRHSDHVPLWISLDLEKLKSRSRKEFKDNS